MKDKIFIDTDIFLDTLLARKPYYAFSNQILSLCEYNEVKGFTSCLVIANIYYILNKLTNRKKAIHAVSTIRAIIRVLPCTDKEIGESINSEFKDFEDGLQYFIAINNDINCIITRNIKDFKKSSISIVSAEQYLESRKLRHK